MIVAELALSSNEKNTTADKKQSVSARMEASWRSNRLREKSVETVSRTDSRRKLMRWNRMANPFTIMMQLAWVISLQASCLRIRRSARWSDRSTRTSPTQSTHLSGNALCRLRLSQIEIYRKSNRCSDQQLSDTPLLHATESRSDTFQGFAG